MSLFEYIITFDVDDDPRDAICFALNRPVEFIKGNRVFVDYKEYATVVEACRSVSPERGNISIHSFYTSNEPGEVSATSTSWGISMPRADDDASGASASSSSSSSSSGETY